MRGAGCTWNDIVDRDIDARVERTRSRPIPSGQVTVTQAAAFLVVAGAGRPRGAAAIQPLHRSWLGIASLAVVVIYPFMKRITYWPQIVLGLAFSWGALMGWPALFGRLDLPALVLYAGSIAWVIGYDTIYAHQDREDDALIGMKSTAILFGARTRPMLSVFYRCRRGADRDRRVLGRRRCDLCRSRCLAFAAHLAWQIVRLDIDDPDLCLHAVQIEPRCRPDPVRRPDRRCRAALLDGSVKPRGFSCAR